MLRQLNEKLGHIQYVRQSVTCLKQNCSKLLKTTILMYLHYLFLCEDDTETH